MERWLQRQWYERTTPPWWLLPFSTFFRVLLILRGWLYRRGFLHQTQVSVPVLIVGNITVGGTGKTPLTMALVQALQARGWHPAILSRGYAARGQGIHHVQAQDDPYQWGDEAVLMAQHTQVPVWVGRQRSVVAQSVLRSHPEVDLLICDDGLQHLALARNVELIVLDGARLTGNGALLPAGPLREPVERLQQATAIIVHGGPLERETVIHRFAPRPPLFTLQFQALQWVHVFQPQETRALDFFRNTPCHAVAGIGNPDRFFSLLRQYGIPIQTHAFPDHHAFTTADLTFTPQQPLLMTEKDGIKCRHLSGLSNVWMLPIEAILEEGLTQLLDHTLRRGP